MAGLVDLLHRARVDVEQPVEPDPSHVDSLAITLIVRNEESRLQALLQEVFPAVDAVYVTDTGSTDATVDVARSLGATVRHASWTDDFAAARNASLEGIRETWVLILDADDRISAPELLRLRRELDPRAFAAALRYAVLEGHTPVPAVRVIRNGQGAVYRGRIHESLEGWIRDRKATGGRLQLLDIVLQHTGYHPAAMPGKALRNLPLLQLEWEEVRARIPDARALLIGANLAGALVQMGHPASACALLSDLVERSMAALPRESLRALLRLAGVHQLLGRPTEALDCLRAAEPHLGAIPGYAVHRGVSEFEAGCFEEALRWLEVHARAAARDTDWGVPVPESLLGPGLWRVMASCHIALGRGEAAVRCVEQAVRLEPDNVENHWRARVAVALTAHERH